MAYMLLGCVLLTTTDAMAKALAARFPVGEILFLRSLCVMIPVLLLVRAQGGMAGIRIVDPRGQVIRALLFMGTSVVFVFSLSALPLPLVTALSFVSPIFMTVLAIPLLGERVDWRNWCAVIAGFVGVLITIDPFAASWSWVAIFPVIGALGSALRDIMTRQMSTRETSTSILFYSTVLTVLLALASAPFGWRWLELGDALIILIVGIMVGCAHYLYIDSLRLCEVTVLAPLKYSMILWS